MKSFNLIYENKEQLKQFIEENSLKENVFIQVFTGILDKDIIWDLINYLKSSIKNVKIIGSSTDGEIINGKVTQNKIILNFNIFNDTKCNTIVIEKKEKSYDLGQKLAKKLLKNDTKLLITFADGINVNGEEFIKGIESINKVIIAGGLAADNALFKETFVFNEEKLITNGCVGASLESDILKVNNEYGFNWEGIGKLMTVTKADKNIVYEIDGKKAKDIYKHYFGEIADDVVKIGVEFPLIINKNNVKIARAVIGQNDDGSLVFAGNINEGDLVQFGYGNIESILSKDANLFNTLAKFDIESIFIYSCMARRRFLEENIKYEIEPFGKIADVSGFFTYGEFFSNNKDNIFFNQTMTVLTLSETTTDTKNVNITANFKNDELQTLKALTNLVKATSQEIMELNKTLEQKVKQKTTQLKAKNMELEYMYYHDNLTSLPNKYLLDKDLFNKIYGGILIDIRNFSSINDLYGEFIGDEILKTFTKTIQKLIQSYNCKIYRVGADQFIILNFEDDESIIPSIIDIIKTTIKNPLYIEAEQSNIAIHIDIRMAYLQKHLENIKVKLDLALNYAKHNNLDIIEYSEELKLEETLEKELKIIDKVKKAIKEDRIIPVFQKIQKPEGDSYECLVRLKEGENLISPFFFLSTIEHTNYYFDITRIMIDKSMKFFKDRKEMISINFSYKDIENDEIVDYLIDKIQEYNMYNRIIIEILESEDINDFENVKNFIKKVKSYGVKIAIDDFGSGYSNFIYLAQIRPDFIKIDGSLIKNLDNDENSLIITKHINNFAKELGCKTVAEFVHNEDVYKIVKEINIDGIQGYFIEKPTPSI